MSETAVTRYCNWMSNENVQAVREVIDAFNRRDFDAAMAPLRDDVTWERFLSRAEATSPAVRGKAELLAVWKSQVEAVDIRVEPEEFIPVGNKVIAPMRMCARGSGSAIELVSVVTWVSTFDDGGLCTKVEAYESRDEALRAAGIGTSAEGAERRARDRRAPRDAAGRMPRRMSRGGRTTS